ncbi:MAG TPA: adenylate cyclase regulatory domain-containing protein [Solirubrobacterales bacterium]
MSAERAGTGIDFESEGLLEGVEGEARDARLELLERLNSEGVPLEQLREAVAAARLTLLPVERALAGDGPRYTPREIAELSGVDLDLLQRATAAIGIPYPDPDSRTLTEAELEAAHRVRAFLDAGLPEDGIIQVARTIGTGTARIAAANRELTVRTLMQPGDTERDLALRFAAAAEHLMPLIEPTLVYALRAHTLEQVRRDVIGGADLASGEIRGTAELAVCFADLVEFTRLGEEIAPEELGSVAGKFEEMAIEVAAAPVRLVKMIGDAAMLVSSEPGAMLEAAVRLVETADAEGEEFPYVRAGIACGPAIAQSGDYYGSSVNKASRISGIARPGSILIDEATKDAVSEGYDYSFAGERRLKGFDGRAKLFRARRAGAPR